MYCGKPCIRSVVHLPILPNGLTVLPRLLSYNAGQSTGSQMEEMFLNRCTGRANGKGACAGMSTCRIQNLRQAFDYGSGEIYIGHQQTRLCSRPERVCHPV